MKKKNNKLKGKTIHFFWGAGNTAAVTFIRWQKMRMGTGGEDTNKIGVGAIVESNWMFARNMIKKIPNGLRRWQYAIRPYTPLYRTNRSTWLRKGAIRRPKVEDL